MFDDVFVDRVEVANVNDAMFVIRQFLEQHRQVTIEVNADESIEICSPMIGHRNPKNPQPTPPQAAVMRKVA